MKKIDYLAKTVLASIFCISVLTISCSTEDKIEEDPQIVYKDQSITEASFLTFDGARSDGKYDFKYTPVIEVEGYNENYSYELKLTGESFNNEYILSLTEPTPKVDSGKELGEILASKVSPSKPIATNPTLVANIDALDMETDTYTVVIIEKESNTELSVEGINNASYVVVDTNATSFLSGTQLESDNWAVLTELNLSVTTFRVRPTITNYINGIGVQLGVYDLNLNLLGVINNSGSNGASAGTYSYRFTSSKVNDIIPENGEYLFRLQESKSASDAASKVYKNAFFQKIQVNKTSGGLVVIKDNEAI